MNARHLFIALAVFTDALSAATRTWDGGGVLERWDSGINWTGNNAPNPNDDLVWPANGITGYETDNDFPSGTQFRSLTITSEDHGAVNGWTHDGNLVQLTNGLRLLEAAASNPTATIKFPIRLAASQIFEIDHKATFESTASINLQSHTLTVDCTGALLEFKGVISGSGGMICDDTVQLYAANTFTGPLTLLDGAVLFHTSGLGTTAGATTLTGRLLSHVSTINEPLVLAGGRVEWATAGAATLGGNFTMQSGGSEIHGTTSGVTATGTWSGSGSLGVPSGRLELTGAVPNTFSGSLFVAGHLLLNRGAVASNGPVSVEDGGLLEWLNSGQAGPNCSLRVSAGGEARFLAPDSVASLEMRGGPVETGLHFLGVKGDVTVNGATSETPQFTGNLRMEGSTAIHHWFVSNRFGAGGVETAGLILDAKVLASPAAGVTVRKAGPGRVQWTGDSLLPLLEVDEGSVWYEGSGLVMDVSLLGGEFRGTGSVRDISAGLSGGLLDAGQTGNLAARNITLNSAVTFTGFSPSGVAEPKLIAGGAITLGNAALELTPAATVEGILGQQLVIIRKDSPGAVSGVFNNPASSGGAPLPEGSIVTASGLTCRLSYAGGDGNDVTLTMTGIAPTGILRTWTGGDPGDQWTHTANWSGGLVPLPGDTVEFGSVADRNPFCDLPPNTLLSSLSFQASGYTLSGQPVALSNGVVLLGGGTTNIKQPLVLAADQAFLTSDGNTLALGGSPTSTVNLNGHRLTLATGTTGSIRIGETAAGSDPAAALTGSGSMVKPGLGTVVLNAPSDFTGPFSIGFGTVRLSRHPHALGSSLAGSETSIEGGTLELNAPGVTVPEKVIFTAGTLSATPGAGNGVTLSGTLVLNGTSRTVDVSSGQLHLSGVISGPAGLLKQGPGELRIAGSFPNTFNGGTTTVGAGTMILAMPAGQNAIASATTGVSSGAVLRLENSEQLTNNVSLVAGATFDLNGRNETLAGVTLAGGTVQTGAGTLVADTINAGSGALISGRLGVAPAGTALTVGDVAVLDDLVISAQVVPGNAGLLTKTGPGRVLFSGANTMPSFSLSGGTAVFTGNSAPTAVSLNGGTLGGTGTVGAITGTLSGGRVEPGLSAGILNCGNVALTPANALGVEIQNATPGAGHDQLNVTGTVNLGGATIEVTVLSGFSMTAGSSAVIIANDGSDAVAGTFAGLAEGATFSTGGRSFSISYAGGSGNDVTLTHIVPGTGTTRLWDGGGADSNWNVINNWDGNTTVPAAGDTLSFPAGAARLNNTNNFPAGTGFNALLVGASGYILNGNALALNEGISFDHTSGQSFVNTPVTLTQPQSFSVLQGATGNMAGGPNFIALAGHTLTLHAAVPAGQFNLSGLSGTGSVNKTGPGIVAFGENSHPGLTNVMEGELLLSTTTAGLGTAAGATVISPGATLRYAALSGAVAEPFTLAGRLRCESSPITFTGTMTLPAGVEGTLDALTSSPLFNGIIAGTGALRTQGSAGIRIGGTSSNTFTGGVTVAGGVLQLQKTAGLNALPGPVTIGTGSGAAELRLSNANQIANAAAVTLNGSASLFNLNNLAEQVATLNFTGGTVQTGSGTLTLSGHINTIAVATSAFVTGGLQFSGGTRNVSVADGAAADDLLISAAISEAAVTTLQKLGAGRLVLAGENDFGTLSVDEGEVRLGGDSGGIGSTVLNGGTLSGSGIIGPVNPGGRPSVLAPGASPGALTVQGDLTLSPEVTLAMEILNTTPGSGHDFLQVNGAVDPGEATLTLTLLPGFTPLIGQQFTIISNDDTEAFTGIFAGLDEGKQFITGGVTFEISYKGGDGNDMVLTLLRINGTGIARTWDGGGGNALWSTAANWQDDIAPVPGDALVFPAGAAQFTAQNDFPAGTTFQSLTILANGYVISGNQAVLNAGVECDSPNGPFNQLLLPVRLSQSQAVRVLSGSLDLAGGVDSNAHTLTLDVATGAGLSTSTAPISGAGTLQKAGPGTLSLNNAHTFTGPVSLLAGTCAVGHSSALGAGSGGVFIGSNATLRLSGSTPLSIADSISLGAASAVLTVTSGSHTVTGTLSLFGSGARRISVGSGASLAVGGRVSGTGLLRKTDAGILTLGGTLANNFTGGLTVECGDVILGKPPGITAVGGPIVIGDAGSVPQRRLLLAASGQIADTSSVSILLNNSTFDLAGFDETIAALNFTGGRVQTGAGTLTLDGDITCTAALSAVIITGNLAFSGSGTHNLTVPNGPANPDFPCTAALSAPGGATLRKLGDGTASFSGPSCSIPGIIAEAGLLNWFIHSPGTSIDLNGGTLSGTVDGALNQLTSQPGGGIISPFFGPLSVSNLNLNGATTVLIRLTPSPGGGRDHIVIQDESFLGGAVLELVQLDPPSIGETFTLIDATGTGIQDSFAGLPEGTVFVRNGTAFQITYHGGDGNDTVITVIEPADPVITSSGITPGTGGQSGFQVINLTGSGIPGAPYLLEFSTDLILWSTLQSTNASPAGVWSFTDSTLPDSTSRTFVRVRLF